MSTATIATANTRRGRQTPSPFGKIIGWQEAKTPEARKRIRNTLTSHDHYIPSEGWGKSILVSWDADRFAAIPAAEWAPDLLGPELPADVTIDGRGLSWLVVDPVKGVTPGRGWTLVLLRERTTGRLLFVLNGHPINSAWSKRPVVPRRRKIDGRWQWVGGKSWRQEQWNAQHAVATSIVAAAIATRRDLAATADWNRPNVQIPGLENPREVQPRGIQAYDQILATPDLDPRSFRRAGAKAGSDHYPRKITITTTAKEPTVTGYYLLDHPPAQRQFRERGTTASGVVVIHTAESIPDVTGDDQGAEAVAGFIQRRSDFGSYHSLIDSDSIVPLIPFHLQAYGDGTGSNPHAIHLSMATKADAWGRMPDAWVQGTLENLAEEAHRASDYLEKLHGVRIPARRISRAQSDERVEGFISHAERDPARRSDPGHLFPWTRFLALYAKLEAGDVAPPGTRGEEIDLSLRRLSGAITHAERARAREGSERDQAIDLYIQKLKLARRRGRDIPHL